MAKDSTWFTVKYSSILKYHKDHEDPYPAAFHPVLQGQGAPSQCFGHPQLTAQLPSSSQQWSLSHPASLETPQGDVAQQPSQLQTGGQALRLAAGWEIFQKMIPGWSHTGCEKVKKKTSSHIWSGGMRKSEKHNIYWKTIKTVQAALYSTMLFYVLRWISSIFEAEILHQPDTKPMS